MYSVERTDYGFKLCFAGFVTASEMKQWANEIDMALKEQTKSFGILLDIHEMKPLAYDSRKILETGQKLFRIKGMKRSAILLADPVRTFQQSGNNQNIGRWDYERYFDKTENPAAEEHAVKWVASGL